VAVGLISTLVALLVVTRTVDTAALHRAARRATDDPRGIVLSLAALLGAFSLRALAWRKVVPELPFGQSLAGIHVGMGANHVLPLRMGEPLRVASVVRRTGVPLGVATASTLTLRTADIVCLAALGAVCAPHAFLGIVGPWGWAVLVLVLAAGAVSLTWLARLARERPGTVRLPGPAVFAATGTAWMLEAVVIWRAAGWVGIHLDPLEAMFVTAVAVGAQVTAIAPSGFGTYEAAAVAALSALGHDTGVALVAALSAHALKTAYSLGAGAVGLVTPAPSFLGRVRLPRSTALASRPVAPAPDGPVVLFLPAHDEAEAVAGVVRRAPRAIAGREVRVVVIDDGSTDGTAAEAARAGADVIVFDANRGLGAAVREGLRHAVVVYGAAAVAFCDADGEYAPEELEQLVGPVLAGRAHYVVGSRFRGHIEHMLPQRRAGNRVLTRALRFVARTPITDGQSGYRAFSRDAAAHAEIVHDYNYAQVLTLDLLAKGYGYVEVPISYRFRVTGRSFIRLGRYVRFVVPAVYRELNAPDSSPVADRSPVLSSSPALEVIP
jgi:uncharacterized membrane protein YbhN (UPF0104 family)